MEVLLILSGLVAVLVATFVNPGCGTLANGSGERRICGGVA